MSTVVVKIMYLWAVHPTILNAIIEVSNGYIASPLTIAPPNCGSALLYTLGICLGVQGYHVPGCEKF